MKAINVELPDHIHAQIAERAEMKGRSIKKEIIQILEQFFSETREVDVSLAELQELIEMRAERKRRAE